MYLQRGSECSNGGVAYGYGRNFSLGMQIIAAIILFPFWFFGFLKDLWDSDLKNGF